LFFVQLVLLRARRHRGEGAGHGGTGGGCRARRHRGEGAGHGGTGGRVQGTEAQGGGCRARRHREGAGHGGTGGRVQGTEAQGGGCRARRHRGRVQGTEAQGGGCRHGGTGEGAGRGGTGEGAGHGGTGGRVQGTEAQGGGCRARRHRGEGAGHGGTGGRVQGTEAQGGGASDRAHRRGPTRGQAASDDVQAWSSVLVPSSPCFPSPCARAAAPGAGPAAAPWPPPDACQGPATRTQGAAWVLQRWLRWDAHQGLLHCARNVLPEHMPGMCTVPAHVPLRQGDGKMPVQEGLRRRLAPKGLGHLLAFPRPPSVGEAAAAPPRRVPPAGTQRWPSDPSRTCSALSPPPQLRMTHSTGQGQGSEPGQLYWKETRTP